MKLPPKAILIRIAIYGPIILGMLAYYAFFRGSDEAPQADVPVETKSMPGMKRKMKLPDGTEVEYFEITPEEARQMGVEPNPEKQDE
jgi:hypothetical protein